MFVFVVCGCGCVLFVVLVCGLWFVVVFVCVCDVFMFVFWVAPLTCEFAALAGAFISDCNLIVSGYRIPIASGGTRSLIKAALAARSSPSGGNELPVNPD